MSEISIQKSRRLVLLGLPLDKTGETVKSSPPTKEVLPPGPLGPIVPG